MKTLPSEEYFERFKDIPKGLPEGFKDFDTYEESIAKLAFIKLAGVFSIKVIFSTGDVSGVFPPITIIKNLISCIIYLRERKLKKKLLPPIITKLLDRNQNYLPTYIKLEIEYRRFRKNELPPRLYIDLLRLVLLNLSKPRFTMFLPDHPKVRGFLDYKIRLVEETILGFRTGFGYGSND